MITIRMEHRFPTLDDAADFAGKVLRANFIYTMKTPEDEMAEFAVYCREEGQEVVVTTELTSREEDP